MLWACISSRGPGNLVRVHEILNALKYQDILKQNLVASARKLKMGRHWVFQQDNDPKRGQIYTEMVHQTQNQAPPMAISVPRPQPH